MIRSSWEMISFTWVLELFKLFFFLGVNVLLVSTFWTFFYFGPYIFISPLLVPKPISAWHLNPCRQPTNKKSIRGWRRNKISLFFYTWHAPLRHVAFLPQTQSCVCHMRHSPTNLMCRHWKSPNHTWIPRITLSVSLEPSASLSNHHHQPSLSLEATIIINHLSRSSTISKSLIRWKQALQPVWTWGGELHWGATVLKN